jgi:hypothetical protein
MNSKQPRRCSQAAGLPESLSRASDIYLEMVEKLEDALSADTDKARECLGFDGKRNSDSASPYGAVFEGQNKSRNLQQIAGFTLNMVAGAGFEPTTFGL